MSEISFLKYTLCNYPFRRRGPAYSRLVEAEDDPELCVGAGGQRPAGPRATSAGTLHTELWYSSRVNEQTLTGIFIS